MTDSTASGDDNLGRLFEAADALEESIREVTGFDEGEVGTLYEQNRAWIIDTPGDEDDPLSRHGELAIAAVRALRDVAFTELRARQVVPTRTCFRAVPPADMYEIAGLKSTFWVCEHRPSHRDP